MDPFLEELLRTATGERDHRPWGWYLVLLDAPWTKVKLLFVKRGTRLSLQRHKFRDEHWITVSGILRATLQVNQATEPTEIECATTDHPYGARVFVPRGAAHRIECPEGDQDLLVIEVQVGDKFPEDDNERLQDDWQRTSPEQST
jgi:mannose-6-phosphate isomerase-like protein (cupin superfamily)